MLDPVAGAAQVVDPLAVVAKADGAQLEARNPSPAAGLEELQQAASSMAERHRGPPEPI